MSREWEAVHAHCLLQGRSEAEVEIAVRVVSRGLHLPMPTPARLWTVDKLAAKVADYLEAADDARAYDALPKRHGYTEAEWDDIMSVMREVNAKALRRHIQQVEAFTWFVDAEEAMSALEAQLETIQGQQRVIDSLLDYLADLPLPAAGS